MSVSTSTSATAADDVPRLKTLRVATTWEGRQRARHSIRTFEARTGEPERLGGDDSAPTPMELILAGLDGCLAVVVETVAAERGLALRALELSSEAVMDQRGFAGVPGVRPYYTTIRTRIGLDAGPGGADALRAEVERRCPALGLVRAADVDVELTWQDLR